MHVRLKPLWILGFALAILGSCINIAHAQTRVEPLKLSWGLPTVGCSEGVTPCDGKPLTGADALTAIEVYINTVPIQDNSSMQPTVVLQGTPVSTATSYSAKVGDTLYIRVKARNGTTAANLSPFSAQITYDVKAPPPVKPGAPTNVRVELIIAETPPPAP